jgi:hypothetical protein
MGKTSSMASLREKALAFLRDEGNMNGHNAGSGRERNIVDLAAQETKKVVEVRGRPATPSAGSMLLGANGKVEKGKHGFFGKLKGLVGGKKVMERLDEGVI